MPDATSTLGAASSTPIRGTIRENFPSPTQPPPDLVSPGFEHMLVYGSMRELTDEELARAVQLDPSQIAGLGPEPRRADGDAAERKAEDPGDVRDRPGAGRGRQAAIATGRSVRSSRRASLQQRFQQAFDEEQTLRPGTALVSRRTTSAAPFARAAGAAGRPAGRQVPDRRTGRQVRVHRPHAADAFPRRWKSRKSWRRSTSCSSNWKKRPRPRRSASSTWTSWRSSPSRATSSKLRELQPTDRRIPARTMAEQQGLERTARGYQLTPKAYRLFQGRLLERIFSKLEAAAHRPAPGADRRRRRGRAAADQALRVRRLGRQHGHPRLADQRHDPRRPAAAHPLQPDDIEIHRTRNTPKCATVVLMDMSGSMRYDGLYVNVKRMGLALEGLIRREYPGDYLQFIEIYTFAKPRHVSEIAALMPKPVTIFDPVVRLRADMSDPTDQRVRHSAALHQHPARPAAGPAVPGRPGHAQPADHPDHRRAADGALRRPASLPALSARPRHRGGHAARRAALPARRDHDQYLPAPQLVAVARRRPVRLSAGRIDRGPRLLHRRQRPGPLRGLGLLSTAAARSWAECPGATRPCSCAGPAQHRSRDFATLARRRSLDRAAPGPRAWIETGNPGTMAFPGTVVGRERLMRKICEECHGTGERCHFKGESRFLLSRDECPACCGLGFVEGDEPEPVENVPDEESHRERGP